MAKEDGTALSRDVAADMVSVMERSTAFMSEMAADGMRGMAADGIIAMAVE